MVTTQVYGASTRDIGQIIEALMGEHVLGTPRRFAPRGQTLLPGRVVTRHGGVGARAGVGLGDADPLTDGEAALRRG
jgi:hypothetical protein